MRYFAEPTFRDLLADPLVRSVMSADHVDPHALEAMLRSVALGGDGKRDRKPAIKLLPPPDNFRAASAGTLCGTGCSW